MSTSRNDGGPAFPSPADFQFQGTPDERMLDCRQFGMSLRDWLAGHEKSTPPMRWLRDKRPDMISWHGDEDYTDSRSASEKAAGRADWRYLCADAMLEARK